ncbi:hypothetical protein Pfo_004275 [Paulownia fortunei]|nr:hypothetical protein Pfo_004275 [Paulownia fortunei]
MELKANIIGTLLLFLLLLLAVPGFSRVCMMKIWTQRFMILITEVRRHTPTFHHRIGPGPGPESIIKPAWPGKKIEG